MNGNPILLVRDAGQGETPPCPEGRFKAGDVVLWKAMPNHADYLVAVAVPPHFPAEYALADLTKTARPLMITKPSRAVTYVLVHEGDPQPYLAKERALKPAGKPPVDIGTVLYA